jgi:hypothetical protein
MLTRNKYGDCQTALKIACIAVTVLIEQYRGRLKEESIRQQEIYRLSWNRKVRYGLQNTKTLLHNLN